jgi:transposase InsO family protein/transposase-like protein
MRSKRRSLRKQWSVSEKLEVVQARQNGLTLDELRSLYGSSGSTVLKWVRSYEERGIAGLEPAPTGGAALARSHRVEAAGPIIEQITQDNPNAGTGKVQGELYRRGFLDLARETVRRILRGQGQKPQPRARKRRNKPPQVKSFERASPNDLWQTDIMTFMLKGQYRIYLIGFMDDNSRFIVGWGLYRFQTAANVQEVFRAAIEKHGMPKEVLSDNGRQYHSWRGKSQFTQMLLKLGIRHIRSRPYHPQTCGKIESFWRNLYQECLSKVPVATFDEALGKIGEYIEYYNFKRPHQGIGNLMPSDRFYRVDGQVKQIIAATTAKVEEQAAPMADYRPPTYIVGNIGGKELRVVAREAEVSLRDEPTDESQTAEPARATGPNSDGAGQAAANQTVVPTSGGVPGAVLSLDGAGQTSGPNGAGGQSAGAQGGQGESGCGGAVEVAASQDREAGERKEGTSQGEGPLEAAGGVRAEDNQAAGVGPVTQGGV